MKETPNNKASWAASKKLLQFLKGDTHRLALALLAILISSVLSLAAPYIFGHAIDTYVLAKNYPGIIKTCFILIGIYAAAFVASYLQMQLMGRVGQNLLFKLRERIFTKLQSLPISFFNQQKTGDLISRINNDTDKLNQFFSDTLVRFMGSLFIIVGTAVFILSINLKLGIVALLPAVGLLIYTQLLSSWVKTRNAKSLQSVGSMSAEIQESLSNFKVIVAFNRRDYFRERFKQANDANFSAAIRAGLANNAFAPMYDFSSDIAQLIVLVVGTSLVLKGSFTLGLLVSFFIYLDRFYTPLRQMAFLWPSFQLAMAGWDRVAAILESDAALPFVEANKTSISPAVLEFEQVSFQYPNGKEVLRKIDLRLDVGKTYALVGPTGGGKTTIASLMARLYDPTQGMVRLSGKDIRSYSADERTQQIGFILQEPFLFTGTLLDNLFYGNTEAQNLSNEERKQWIQRENFDRLLARFDGGLETAIETSRDTMSLGQRQLIAFMRAVLRKPKLLILDEATANIDTVTEQLLEETLLALPKDTTKVIIAHRLNTIENADHIFFVNDGEVVSAGSLEKAIELLKQHKRQS